MAKEKSKAAEAARRLAAGGRRFVASTWFGDMLGAFVATTLGILITLGTSAYYAQNDKQERAETITRRTLRYIHTATGQLTAEAEKMAKADSVFQYFYRIYPDSMAYADPAMAERLIDCLGYFSANLNNSTVEKIFSSSYTTWESISSDGFIDFVGTAFNIIGKLNADLNETQQKRLDVYFDAITAEGIHDIGSPKEFAANIMGRQDMRKLIIWHRMSTMVITNTVDMLRQMQNEYMKKMGMTPRDLFEASDSTEVNLEDTATLN